MKQLTVNEKLIELAKIASENAYAPYSNFNVGASLYSKGAFFVGANVENASYGLTMCAERSCIFSAISNGVKPKDIDAFCIYSPSDKLVYPCGACLQVLQEMLNKDTPIIICYGKENKFITTNIASLLPNTFSKEDL